MLVDRCNPDLPVSEWKMTNSESLRHFMI